MIMKPSDKEQEYFQRQELERLKKQREESAANVMEDEKKKIKELHWMHCPKCGMELTEVEYRGVQVDNCFSCGGMFLDAGEAEKILSFEEPGALGKMFGYFVGKD